MYRKMIRSFKHAAFMKMRANGRACFAGNECPASGLSQGLGIGGQEERRRWALIYPAAEKTRSKQYSSITAATDFLPLSSSARTTRPEQFTRTSVSVPRTIAGNTMRKRITVPTSSAALVWNSTPPAEMSAVSAKCSLASFVRIVRGSLSGNRTELREWFTRAPLAFGLGDLYTRRGNDPKITLVFSRTERTCASDL